MSYIITKNLIDETLHIITKKQEQEYPYFFELSDGDDKPYYQGYSSINNSFEPVDGLGSVTGCVTIKYLSENGKLEKL